MAAIVWLEKPKTATQYVKPIVKGQEMPVLEIVGSEGYVNVKNLSLSELVGKKMILVDFWTYSCVNCQRTLLYLIAWCEKYGGKGLEVVGIHAPEFDFEKNIDNVCRVVQKWKIR